MNPVIVIPTYWTTSEERVGNYDHATPVDATTPELARCLDSLEQVRGVMRTVVLLVAPPEAERKARVRVDEICAAHPRLTPLVIGDEEARPVVSAITSMAPRLSGETVSLRGYGAIRNMGLMIASIFGHDVVVFFDDDEVALGPEFLVEAVYGLGQRTRQNLPVVAKSGYFVDEKGSPYAEVISGWTEKYWDKGVGFNKLMARALEGTRISRSNVLCGGCMAIHAEAFTRVAFDPYITRGEDLDYLINLRLYGMDVWFDNRWRVMHLPPTTPTPANRFRQNVFRWHYEKAKLDFANGKIDLNQVTPQSLMPYPGPWIGPELEDRVAQTALRRALGTKDHGAYLDIWRNVRAQAEKNARRHGSSYLTFQSWWPAMVQRLWGNAELARVIQSTGVPAAIRDTQAPALDEKGDPVVLSEVPRTGATGAAPLDPAVEDTDPHGALQTDLPPASVEDGTEAAETDDVADTAADEKPTEPQPLTDEELAEAMVADIVRSVEGERTPDATEVPDPFAPPETMVEPGIEEGRRQDARDAASALASLSDPVPPPQPSTDQPDATQPQGADGE